MSSVLLAESIEPMSDALKTTCEVSSSMAFYGSLFMFVIFAAMGGGIIYVGVQHEQPILFGVAAFLIIIAFATVYGFYRLREESSSDDDIAKLVGVGAVVDFLQRTIAGALRKQT